MKHKMVLGAVAAALLIAGCTGANNDSSEKTADLSDVEALIENASDDGKALDAWKTILLNTASAYGNNYHVEGDSNVYEYTTADDSSFVNDHFLYRVGRDSVAMKDNGEEIIADLTDVNNSDNALQNGYGYLGQFGADGFIVSLDLTETSESSLKGNITAELPSTETVNDAILENMMDTLVDYGYIRYVDPFHNASLYNFNLSTSDGTTTLEVSIKDLDAFRQQAAIKTVLIDDYTNRAVLGLDQVENETYTFTFNSEGILTEVDNNVFHALSALDHSAYVSIGNKTMISQADDKNLNTQTVVDFISKVKDGEYADDAAFELDNWK